MNLLPTDENGLYRWVAGLMVGYLAVAYPLSWRAEKQLFNERLSSVLLPIIFNSGTFAVSILLFIGIMDDSILKLIGSTKPYLLVAGFGGTLYALHALVPPKE